jgi:hypothetical protein
MIQTRSLKIVVFVASLIALLAFSAAAQQTDPDRNYDITLQLVIGSNDAGPKNEIPANLAPITKQIRSSFDFSSYRLASTFLGRVATNGHFEYNSVASIDGKDMSSTVPTLLEWSLRDLHPSAGGRGLQATSFRFGAKVPIVVGDAGKQSVNYEGIGVNINRVGLSENTPTLIGTLHLPGTSGTIFLVMTIRAI